MNDYITLHLVDGRKITKRRGNLLIYAEREVTFGDDLEIKEGCITVNWDNVTDMRFAEPDEIEHAEIHGW